MIKVTRRDSLKLFSLAGLAAVLPANVFAKLSSSGRAGSAAIPAIDSTGIPVSELAGSIEISIHRIVASEAAKDYALVKISNNSQKLETVRHFYSSVVHSDGQDYDLNELLVNGPLLLMPGESRQVRLMPVRAHGTRENVAKLHSWSKPVIVKTKKVVSDSLQDVQTVRWIYV